MSEQENPVEEMSPEAKSDTETATEESATEQESQAEVQETASSQPDAEISTDTSQPAETAPAQPRSNASTAEPVSRPPRPARRGRDSREEPAPAPRATSGAPPEYVRPTYRGRSRRVEESIDINELNYRNIPLLTKFLDPYGRILSRRKTRVSAKIQRKAVAAIKQARHLCLLPYTGEHMRVARRKRRR